MDQRGWEQHCGVAMRRTCTLTEGRHQATEDIIRRFNYFHSVPRRTFRHVSRLLHRLARVFFISHMLIPVAVLRVDPSRPCGGFLLWWADTFLTPRYGL